MQMVSHGLFGQVEAVGKTLLEELAKPNTSVAILDGVALDMMLMYHRFKDKITKVCARVLLLLLRLLAAD